MTEQEAIAVFEEILAIDYRDTIPKYYKAMELAVKDMEEVQKYRTIGTPEECRAAVEKQRAKKHIIKYKKTQDCVTEVEWKCPICGTNYIELAPCGEWCRYCGTKLDWGKEE